MTEPWYLQSAPAPVDPDPLQYPTVPGVRSGATALLWATGTLAARPAAGVLGRFYYETTTPALTFDNGTAWKVVTLT